MIPNWFTQLIDNIFVALDKNSINDDAKKEVLAILWSLKGMIISQ